MINPYKVLGVHRESSDVEIKSHHRTLCMELHPDRDTGDKDKFIEVQEAYRAIRNLPARNLLATKMQGLGEPCDYCHSTGVHRKMRGFQVIGKTPCKLCDGCGYVLR